MKFNKLVPELSVSDFEKSLEFYIKLGFKVEYTREKFAFLSLEGSQIMIEEANDTWKTGELEHPFGRGINFQIEVKDIKKILKALKEHALFREPEDHWYKVKDKQIGCREFLVQDPDGYLLRFSENIGSS
ncbi:VOC family protein [Candidatus Woesearchaeota archaeon]|nr:VOC family protein [Candidatus Woesearchaeota archaeon]